jgi:hypothetical protein
VGPTRTAALWAADLGGFAPTARTERTCERRARRVLGSPDRRSDVAWGL